MQQTLWENIQSNWTQYAWNIAGVILIWVLASAAVRIVARLIASSYRKRAAKLSPERQRRVETASTVVQSVSRYLIWFMAAAGIIGQLGLTSTMGSMLAAAGVGGIAIGIGAQSFVKDVVAGLFLVLEDQMAVGDYVLIAGITGTVEEITLRTTVVRGFRGEINVIPNGSIAVLTNYSRADYLALLDINIAYEADLQRAMDCMREEAEAYAKESGNAVEAPEVLGVTALTDSGITLRLVLRVKPMTQWATERALNARIKERYSREGIEIPYQKIVVMGSERGHRADSVSVEIEESGGARREL